MAVRNRARAAEHERWHSTGRWCSDSGAPHDNAAFHRNTDSARREQTPVRRSRSRRRAPPPARTRGEDRACSLHPITTCPRLVLSPELMSAGGCTAHARASSPTTVQWPFQGHRRAHLREHHPAAPSPACIRCARPRVSVRSATLAYGRRCSRPCLTEMPSAPRLQVKPFGQAADPTTLTKAPAAMRPRRRVRSPCRERDIRIDHYQACAAQRAEVAGPGSS